MATDTSTPCDGNTLRDGSTHHIKELNGRTAPLGLFAVSVYRARMDTYEYTRSNVVKQGKTFRCILVSTSNPQQYIRAELGKKGDDAKPLEKAYIKFEEFLRFRMANVSLKADVKQEYLHTLQKILVNFEKTSLIHCWRFLRVMLHSLPLIHHCRSHIATVSRRCNDST